MEIPLPTSGEDFDRWAHTRLARRILYGTWKADLEKRVRKQINPKRAEVWGTVDLSSNIFRNVCDETAALYHQAPITHHPDNAGLELLKKVDESGYWSLMQRVQRDTIGLKECLVRIDISPDGEPIYTPVFPDMVVARSQGSSPEHPTYLEYLNRRIDSKGKMVWVWDIYDISGDAPTYKVVERTDSKEADRTEEFLGGDFSGNNYPYMFADGKPFIPFVIYHASKTGEIWDPYSNRELVEGTMEVGVKYTFFSHLVRNASWPQRYGINIRPAGAIHDEGSASMAVDPTTVAVFEAADPETASQIGQWVASAEPHDLLEAIVKYERRLVSFAGIEASEVARMSGDPRSAAALSISLEGKRRQQRKYQPVFRVVDLELLSKTAALLNRVNGSSYPEDGYSIHYTALPRSAEEQQKVVDSTIKLLSVGMIDPIDAFVTINPDKTREEANTVLHSLEPVSNDAPNAEPVAAEPEQPEQTPEPEKEEGDLMNGAQVQAAQGIVVAVASGQLPRDAGVQMLSAFFKLPVEEAEKIMGSVGRTFKITPTE